MAHIVSSKVSQARIARWLEEAKPVDNILWTETRLALVVGGHTYLVTNGQVFPCTHCGRYDPEWKAHEVLDYFLNNFGIKPVEIEIECSIKIKGT